MLGKKFIENTNNTIEKIKNFILYTSDFKRNDRLWPSHFLVFETNPLNIAYGACGISLFLNEYQTGVSDRIKDWMLSQKINTDNYPPGLYIGLSGIAYTFFNIGLVSKAEEIMEMAYTSNLLFEEPNMFLGVAGWGLVSLYFYQKTGKELYKEKAIQAGNFLKRSAIKKNEGTTWIYNQDNKIHYGYGYGASGIALFLLYLGVITSRTDFLKYAKSAFEFEISQSNQYETGLEWRRFANDSITLPYTLHGSSGIGSVAIRFYSIFQEIKYLRVCEKIADSAFVRFSVLPTLLWGLSGIGEFMLDMYWHTGKAEYLQKAKKIAESVCWFKIEQKEGVVFPGRYGTRVSTDFATGSAGVGLFLNRLIHKKSRLLFDFPIISQRYHK